MQGGFGQPPGGGGGFGQPPQGGGGFGAPPQGGGGFGAPPQGGGGGFGAPPQGGGGGFGAPPQGGGGFGAPPPGGFGQQGGQGGSGFGPPPASGPSVGAPPPAPPPGGAPGGGGGGEEPNNIGLFIAIAWLLLGLLGCLATGAAAATMGEGDAVMVSYLGVPLFISGVSAILIAPFLRTKGAGAAIGAPIGCGCAGFLVTAVMVAVFYQAIWPSL
jgi:hypothetical protein